MSKKKVHSSFGVSTNALFMSLICASFQQHIGEEKSLCLLVHHPLELLECVYALSSRKVVIVKGGNACKCSRRGVARGCRRSISVRAKSLTHTRGVVVAAVRPPALQQQQSSPYSKERNRRYRELQKYTCIINIKFCLSQITLAFELCEFNVRLYPKEQPSSRPFPAAASYKGAYYKGRSRWRGLS